MDKNRWSHGMSEGRCHETEQEEGRLVEMINSTAEEAGKKIVKDGPISPWQHRTNKY